MSWSIKERIGEFRPFPAQVVVYKGNTDECLAYVSGEVADRLKAENTKLRDEFRKMDEWHSKELVAAIDENAKLRELVKAAWNCIHAGLSCSDCRLIAGGCTLQTAMHELGVDDG